ncbi:uncharacterized protein BDZ99DRAFT_75338 [Mytilinidion resinicola]|uniref:Uncharacterized protein n=1 Tax=Mytilinidion resinicola TaxID=574789 RepID=A0A6A6YGM6_9PEZI|nr:uncharacterized protein BDZ99DRAFT_75338 [Mytilinidion resinicola]KAF2807164.1 hypothetical protein BDZ99DRAFT_75338 [Mytilinidion resinicola]
MRMVGSIIWACACVKSLCTFRPSPVLGRFLGCTREVIPQLRSPHFKIIYTLPLTISEPSLIQGPTFVFQYTSRAVLHWGRTTTSSGESHLRTVYAQDTSTLFAPNLSTL